MMSNSSKSFFSSIGRHRGLLAIGLALALFSCSKKSAGTADLRGGETRQTLPAYNFTGYTAEAYEAAKAIPEVLDSLYCYCDCEKHFGHKSLLSCFVDEHAVHCDICLDEAVMAYEMHKQGKDIPAIRKAVDGKYSNLSH